MAFTVFYDTTHQDQTQLDEFLRETDHYLEYVAGPISLENLRNEVEVISVFVSSQITREMLDKMPKLRHIACRSTGFNNVDLQTARERGITVTNVPSYGNHTVAEYTFALLLALSRKLVPTLEEVQKGKINQETIRGVDLYQKTFGIIGAGRIGQASARIAKAFGMHVIAFDPFPNMDAAAEIGFEFRDLEVLLQQSDVLSLHAPLTDSSRRLLNADTFTHVKRGALLVNTARGELIDTPALINALHDGTLAGAALDVLEGEKMLDVDEEILLLRKQQLSNDVLQQGLQVSVLEKMPNVLLTPHNAFNTEEAIRRINETAAQNIIRFWYDDVPNKVLLAPLKAGKLVIVRHAESEWNAVGKWTDTRDVHLSEKGFKESAQLGRILTDITFDYAYCSQQIRTFETMEGILNASQQFDVPYERLEPINERDYGEYTGMNKWNIRDQIGEEMFHRIRRDWDCPVPNGETLKMVHERVLPFYKNVVLPRLKDGEDVLIVSHGNSIRALIKYIEKISDADIAETEMVFGTALIYDVDDDGCQLAKETRYIDSAQPKA